MFTEAPIFLFGGGLKIPVCRFFCTCLPYALFENSKIYSIFSITLQGGGAVKEPAVADLKHSEDLSALHLRILKIFKGE